MTKSIGQYDKYRWKIKPFPTKQKLPVLLPQRAGRQGAVLLAFFHKFVAALRAGDLDVAFSSGHADLLLALRAAKMPVGAQIQQSGCLGREKAAHRRGHLQKLLVFFIALADIFRKIRKMERIASANDRMYNASHPVKANTIFKMSISSRVKNPSWSVPYLPYIILASQFTSNSSC